jgi:hypothetical protein
MPVPRSANAQHGHRRANEDKRRYVEIILDASTWLGPCPEPSAVHQLHQQRQLGEVGPANFAGRAFNSSWTVYRIAALGVASLFKELSGWLPDFC